MRMPVIFVGHGSPAGVKSGLKDIYYEYRNPDMVI
jgi:hypothetical protein